MSEEQKVKTRALGYGEPYQRRCHMQFLERTYYSEGKDNDDWHAQIVRLHNELISAGYLYDDSPEIFYGHISSPRYVSGDSAKYVALLTGYRGDMPAYYLLLKPNRTAWRKSEEYRQWIVKRDPSLLAKAIDRLLSRII